MWISKRKKSWSFCQIISANNFLLFALTEDACRSSQDKKMCTKLQSVSQQLRDVQQEHQQTMADMRLLVTSMARLQKKVKFLEAVGSPFSSNTDMCFFEIAGENSPDSHSFATSNFLSKRFLAFLLHSELKEIVRKSTHCLSLNLLTQVEPPCKGVVSWKHYTKQSSSEFS